jgi:hypothetical protein
MVVFRKGMKPRGLHIPNLSGSSYIRLTAPLSAEYHMTDIPTLDLL